MAKGQQRGNREHKKPKQQKPKAAAGATIAVSAPLRQTGFSPAKKKK
jgi:hypothetical protein